MTTSRYSNEPRRLADAIRAQPRAEPISRPTNMSEEEDQLRIAMELSLQEQQKTVSLKDDYEVRLQVYFYRV